MLHSSSGQDARLSIWQDEFDSRMERHLVPQEKLHVMTHERKPPSRDVRRAVPG